MGRAFLEKLFWFTGWIYDFSKAATFLLFFGLLTHYFIVSVLVVRGRSMEPNYVDGNVLLVNKLAYIADTPQRGDVIAMYFPGEPEKRFIKRIIGLPGETVKISEGKVYIDGKLQVEPYLNLELVTTPEMERKLVGGEYFAFGDNRAASSDSRAWGPVPRSFIVGKAITKMFSLKSELQITQN